MDAGSSASMRTHPQGAIDETEIAPAAIQSRYERLLEAVTLRGPVSVRDALQQKMGREGACFRNAHGRKPFRVDPVPRLIAADEWTALRRGLAQRADALEAFIRDVYSEQRIVGEGVVPERIIAGSDLFDDRLRGIEVPRRAYVFVYGPDVVRDEQGELLVLEDNLRTPSGISYLLAIRDALGEELGSEALAAARPLDGELGALAAALRIAAPDGVEDPQIAVLTDGSDSPAFYEHCEAARRLEVPLVTLEELEVMGDVVFRRDEDGERHRIDVIYRRTDEAGFSASDGGLTPVGRVLGAPVKEGNLGVANAFGAGIGDDKLTHAYAETLIRFYLGEEPLLRSVRTLDLGDDAQRAEALERADELVFKVRQRAGGLGVVVDPADDESGPGLERIREAVAERPEDYVAQERIALSTLPAVGDEGFEPRRVDLRPFLLRAEGGWEAIPGGLTRFAATRGLPGGQQHPGRWRKGHVDRGVRNEAGQGDGAPLIALTTSEVRTAQDPAAHPPRRADPARVRARDLVRAGDRTGRRGSGDRAADGRGAARAAPRFHRRHLPAGRPGHRSEHLWGEPASAARSLRRRDRPLRAPHDALRRRAGPADPGDLPRRAGAERLPRRHAVPAPSRPRDRRPASPVDTGNRDLALGECRGREPAAPDRRRGCHRGELASTTRGSSASAGTCARSRSPLTRRSRASSAPTASSASACSGTPRPWSTTRCTPPCSTPSWPRAPTVGLSPPRLGNQIREERTVGFGGGTKEGQHEDGRKGGKSSQPRLHRRGWPHHR